MNAINHAKKFIDFMTQNNLGSFYELITVVEESWLTEKLTRLGLRLPQGGRI
jgi:hypothetical protein